jgi:hypothetical protein
MNIAFSITFTSSLLLAQADHTTPVQIQQIEHAIEQLSSRDFAVRHEATMLLWEAGEAARGALERAAGSAPEDWEGWQYEGLFLGAQDTDGEPMKIGVAVGGLVAFVLGYGLYAGVTVASGVGVPASMGPAAAGCGQNPGMVRSPPATWAAGPGCRRRRSA